MEMSGERQIGASREEVWAALNDPDVLKACIPGCQEMEKSSETGFTAKVVQKVGPVKATFTGEVELSDIVVGESYTISGKGKGGAAGAASGGAKVSLADSEEGTLLTYEAEAKVTGKIAQLGSRLIDGFAKKMADQFFTTFQKQVEGGENAEAEAESEAEATEEPQTRTIGESVDEAIDTVKETASDVIEKAEEATRSAASAVAEKIEQAEPEKKGFWRRLLGL
ncbi:MAG: carbon monoxide dehydrogenase subunit G [Pseudomonadota bacterium]